MNRSFQRRIDKLAPKEAEPTYVFWMPSGRSDEVNTADANHWLRQRSLPTKSKPWIQESRSLTKMHVEVIEDLAAVIENARKLNHCVGEQV